MSAAWDNDSYKAGIFSAAAEIEKMTDEIPADMRLSIANYLRSMAWPMTDSANIDKAIEKLRARELSANDPTLDDPDPEDRL